MGKNLPEDRSLFAAQPIHFAHKHPLNYPDMLLIGADTAFRRGDCNCPTWFSRGNFCSTEVVHPLNTLTSFAAMKYEASSANSPYGRSFDILSPVAEHRYYKDVLIEAWECEPDHCHPDDLDVLGGILVSRCTQNAVRCSLVSLLWNPGMRRWLQRFRSSSRGQGISVWDDFWDHGPDNIAKLWEDHEEWRSGISYIIVMCLKYLVCTGYDSKSDEFNVLLVQDRKRLSLERLVLKPSTHSWIRLLADSIDACALAAVEESCLSITTEEHQQLCLGNSINSAKSNFRPRLQTMLAINRSLNPFLNLHSATIGGSCILKNKITEETAVSDFDITALKAGTQIRLTVPDCHLRVVRPLSTNHLLLEEDTRARVNTQEGHREYFNELDVDAIPRILVHIQSLDLSTYKRPQHFVHVEPQNPRYENTVEVAIRRRI